MKKLCIFVPTKNRSRLIKYYIDSVFTDLKKYNIDLYIYDSSDDCLTSEIVDQYEISNIHYHKNDNYTDLTTDRKIVEGFELLINKYDYVWLCGDGYVPTLNNVLTTASQYFDEAYDVIHFIQSKYIEGKKILIPDKLTFFKYCGWYTPYYGSTIVSARLFKSINLTEIYVEMKNTGFLYWYSLFVALNTTNAKIVLLDSAEMYMLNPLKKESTTTKPNAFAKFWFEAWPQAINKLPMDYNEYKLDTCKMVCNETFFPDMIHILRMRANKNLSFAILKKYKKVIVKLVDVPMWKLYLTAMIPIPAINGIRKVYKIIKTLSGRPAMKSQ